jgi:hypothetical protein
MLFGGPIDAILAGMVQHAPKSTATGTLKPKAAAGDSYRGIQLQTPPGRSQFTDAQLRKAVDSAIAKNLQVLSGKR